MMHHGGKRVGVAKKVFFDVVGGTAKKVIFHDGMGSNKFLLKIHCSSQLWGSTH